MTPDLSSFGEWSPRPPSEHVSESSRCAGATAQEAGVFPAMLSRVTVSAIEWAAPAPGPVETVLVPEVVSPALCRVIVDSVGVEGSPVQPANERPRSCVVTCAKRRSL